MMDSTASFWPDQHSIRIFLIRTLVDMESATACGEADEVWELYNDDGFVYKRRKRRRDPVPVEQPAMSTDPQAEERNRKERKRRTLLKLKAQYQREIDQWELLSNSLRATEEKARHSQSQSSVLQKQQTERERLAQKAALGASPLYLPKLVDRLLVDELLLQKQDAAFRLKNYSKEPGSWLNWLTIQVEAQEAMIGDVSNLCDVAEAMCNTQEERLKQSLIDLPIWASPHELIASLCDD